MGKLSAIEWTDSTWNPWMGCTKVSPGCEHCYAERDMDRYGRVFSELRRTGSQTFYAPTRWKEPRRIFTCSWSDFFHPSVAEEWQQEAWDIMLSTPQHTYQVLTKRPGRMAWWAKRHGWPDHIWAGTSLEMMADGKRNLSARLDLLTEVPAKVRFVSAEPLLGPLNLKPYLYRCSCGQQPCICKGLAFHWVIAGGESGPGHRPADLAWFRSLRDQCWNAGVPFFLKQLGGLRPGGPALLDGREWREMPDESR